LLSVTGAADRAAPERNSAIRENDREAVPPVRSAYDYPAWLFDLDGTLYRQPPVRAMMALEVLLWGQSAIMILKAFRQEHERIRKLTLSSDAEPFSLQIRSTANRLGIADEDVALVVDQWMFTRPGRWLRLFRRRWLLAMISRHRSRGGKTAVVSDYPAQRKLAAMGAGDLFDTAVAPGEPGGPHQLKPNPAGLKLAAAQLSVTPAECLVIGDRADADGEAARRAGMAFQHVLSSWPR
jgi:FMN phosphatase YigB (HAD superfamily)